jgi:8-oxo-dGTP diphosphatase
MQENAESDNRWYPQLPMVGVHTLIFKEDKILLAKRAKEPSKDKWSLPGGRLELGETVYQAARREVLEECSIEIEIERLFDVGESIIRDDAGRVKYHFVLIYLLAWYKAGNVRAQSDVDDVKWVRFDELDGLDIHPQLRVVLRRAEGKNQNQVQGV